MTGAQLPRTVFCTAIHVYGSMIFSYGTRVGAQIFAGVADCSLWLNQRNRACQLEVDHHLYAPVQLKKHRRAFR